MRGAASTIVLALALAAQPAVLQAQFKPPAASPRPAVWIVEQLIIARHELRLELDWRRDADDVGGTSEQEGHMRKLIVLTAAAAALLVSACNTVSGLGRDAQAAGRAVTGAAEDAKK